MTISRLVFPEPDGPTRPTVSPRSTTRSMPRRMGTDPAALVRLRCTPSRRMAGDGGPDEDTAPMLFGASLAASASSAYGRQGARINRAERWSAVILLALLVAPRPVAGGGYAYPSPRPRRQP